MFGNGCLEYQVKVDEVQKRLSWSKAVSAALGDGWGWWYSSDSYVTTQRYSGVVASLGSW